MQGKVLPYKQCKLIVPEAGSKDQRWVIAFWVWDKQLRRLKRIRETDFNKRFQAGEERKKRIWCRQRMFDINNMLKAGFIFDREEPDAVIAGKSVSIGQMFDVIWDKVKLTGQRNQEGQKVIKDRFCEYLDKASLLGSDVKYFTAEDAGDFLSHLQLVEGKSMRTIDNYKNGLKTLFKHAQKAKLIVDNPFVGIKNKNRSLGRNLAYTPEQQKELIEFMTEHEPGMLVRCLFMYNTLMRTKEMSHLRISYIRQKFNNKIYLPAEFAKNGTDRHINITPQLERVLAKLELEKYPDSYYVFSWFLKPGEIKLQEDQFGTVYRQKVLDKLGYSKEYTFYSWKHTGVVNAISAGVPTVAVFKQGGWKSWVSFEKYLKSLGLMENAEFEAQHPALMEV